MVKNGRQHGRTVTDLLYKTVDLPLFTDLVATKVVHWMLDRPKVYALQSHPGSTESGSKLAMYPTNSSFAAASTSDDMKEFGRFVVASN
jgi:hypothetical protein